LLPESRGSFFPNSSLRLIKTPMVSATSAAALTPIAT